MPDNGWHLSSGNRVYRFGRDEFPAYTALHDFNLRQVDTSAPDGGFAPGANMPEAPESGFPPDLFDSVVGFGNDALRVAKSN